MNAFTFTTGNELISEVSRGLTTISGTTDIASRVTVNNQLATEDAFSTSFSVDLDLAEGTHEIEVVALAENTFTMTTQKWEVESVNSAERTMSYDTLGNLVNDGARTYEWDAQNRLVAVEIDEVSRSEFAYDGLSRRVGVTEKVWDSNSSSFIIQTSAFYLWDGLEIAEERDASGAVVKRYFGQGEERLHPSTLILEPFYYLRDHLGSVTGVLDASGTMVVEYGYGLWGERTLLSGTGSSDRGFTGHFTHEPSGLVLAPYRAYDPDTARWLSRDPLGEAGGINLYGYVLNNPANAWDPLGLDCILITDNQAAVMQGHSAMITGNGNDWRYDSYGPQNPGRAWDQGVRTSQSFKSLSDAIDFAGKKGYDTYAHFKTTPEQDVAARGAAEKYDETGYRLKLNDCQDMAADMMSAASLNPRPAINPNQFHINNKTKAIKSGRLDGRKPKRRR